MIRFKCLACGAGLKAGDDRVGTKTDCPGCGTAILVPRLTVARQQGGRRPSSPVAKPAEPPAAVHNPSSNSADEPGDTPAQVAPKDDGQNLDGYLRLLVAMGVLQLFATLCWLTASSPYGDMLDTRLRLVLLAFPIQGLVVGIFAATKGRGGLAWGLTGGVFFLVALLALVHLPAVRRRCGQPLSPKGSRETFYPRCDSADEE